MSVMVVTHTTDLNAKRYLDLLKRTLLNLPYLEMDLAEQQPLKELVSKRLAGQDWPKCAHTMIGWHLLENIQTCLTQILEENIPGDVIETGVFRGGACIFMKAILKAYGSAKRVYVADSFEGLPAPSLPQDMSCDLTPSKDYLAVSLEQVQDNFIRYDLLDPQVTFVKGWFKDTLHTLEGPLALIRLDGDMYESTMDALTALYPKLSVGGYIIIDDFGSVNACRQAVTDYCNLHELVEDVEKIDGSGIYWRKTS